MSERYLVKKGHDRIQWTGEAVVLAVQKAKEAQLNVFIEVPALNRWESTDLGKILPDEMVKRFKGKERTCNIEGVKTTLCSKLTMRGPLHNAVVVCLWASPKRLAELENMFCPPRIIITAPNSPDELDHWGESATLIS